MSGVADVRHTCSCPLQTTAAACHSGPPLEPRSRHTGMTCGCPCHLFARARVRDHRRSSTRVSCDRRSARPVPTVWGHAHESTSILQGRVSQGPRVDRVVSTVPCRRAYDSPQRDVTRPACRRSRAQRPGRRELDRRQCAGFTRPHHTSRCPTGRWRDGGPTPCRRAEPSGGTTREWRPVGTATAGRECARGRCDRP